MYLIVAIKKLAGEIRKLEINRSKDLFNAQTGQYLLLKDDNKSKPVCGLITEVKTDRILLIIPGKYKEQLSHWSIGDKLSSIAGPYGEAYAIPQNKTVVCIAEGESALFAYPLVKALNKQKNRVVTLFANVDDHFLFTEEIRKNSLAFHQLTIDRKKLVDNSLTPYLHEYLKYDQISELFAIGHSNTVKEVLQYVASKPELEAKIILNTFVDFEGCIRGMFNVSMSRKSKYITVDGPDFRSVYQSLEQFVNRFPSAEKKIRNHELHSEKMVFHK